MKGVLTESSADSWAKGRAGAVQGSQQGGGGCFGTVAGIFLPGSMHFLTFLFLSLEVELGGRLYFILFIFILGLFF